jgi:hypothetical protein
VYRRFQEPYTEFASTRFRNWSLTKVDDVSGITKGIDQNRSHVLSFCKSKPVVRRIIGA